MKQIGLIVLVVLTSCLVTSAQKCKVYIPTEEGTELVFHNYDKKGKQVATISQKLVSVEEKMDGTYYTLHQKIDGPDYQEAIEMDLKFKCTGEEFIFDMNSFVNQQQMAGMGGDTQMKVSMDAITIPSNIKAGMKLDDGFITLEFQTGPVKMKSTTRISNREVGSEDEIETPAGKFKAFKISSEIESQFSMVKVRAKEVAWYVEGIGAVKTESYSKKGKLMGSTVLASIKK
ncbi:hypothetical protein EYV94_23660 [Puteibacter caeruleilacunae]|nr:hypothetical protein EYV94_23660 [Puteibacter caeruleilacunae]